MSSVSAVPVAPSMRGRLARALRPALVPVGLATAIGVVVHALVSGASLSAVLATAPPVFLVTLTLLELFAGRWRPTLGRLPRDVLFLFLGGALDVAVRTLAGQVAIGVGGEGFGPMAALPLFVSIPLGLVLTDGLAYGVHRGFHAHPLLWRMHALHHHPNELYALMAVVDAPLTVFFVRGLPVVALVALGFPGEVSFAHAILGGSMGLLQHTGIDTRNRWLSSLFITPEVHRLHHSAELAEAGNHALLLTLWDRVFGTHVPPRSDESVPSPGLAEPHALPRTWARLLLLLRS